MSSIELRVSKDYCGILNEDLIVGKENRRNAYGTVVLGNCNFHKNAQLDQFDRDRTLSIVALDGEVSDDSSGVLILASVLCQW